MPAVSRYHCCIVFGGACNAQRRSFIVRSLVQSDRQRERCDLRNELGLSHHPQISASMKAIASLYQELQDWASLEQMMKRDLGPCELANSTSCVCSPGNSNWLPRPVLCFSSQFISCHVSRGNIVSGSLANEPVRSSWLIVSLGVVRVTKVPILMPRTPSPRIR